MNGSHLDHRQKTSVLKISKLIGLANIEPTGFACSSLLAAVKLGDSAPRDLGPGFVGRLYIL